MKCFVPATDEMLFNSNDLKHYQLVPYNNEYVYLKDADIHILENKDPENRTVDSKNQQNNQEKHLYRKNQKRVQP
ncbi:hypothetical protein [Motiliproteus sp. MSK22-1]|uniref:hypothetical protein n=1 Tax=Motiliproteus sp. MSK22-1 TaxID=1897630 RepID=UPI000976A709|nr:hypothetical protein [Motiliproteus sp. MSK22-1]OMH33916.1 hypothetical protein BGP75_13160 [Motiliproteus sp. MSK22-1]